MTRPRVYYQEHISTEDKPQCLSGSNHSDSDYSNHIPADLLELGITVSVCIYNIYANVGRVGVCVYYGSALCTYFNVVDIAIVLQDSSAATNHSRHSYHSSLVCLFFCRMSFADVQAHSLLFFCTVDRSQSRCWLFSLLFWPCWALDHRPLRLPECLGNISAHQSRDHLESTRYGHISRQLMISKP